MIYRCEMPVFSIDAANGLIADRAWITRMFGRGDAVNCF